MKDHPDHPPIEGGYTGLNNTTAELLPAAKAVLKEYWKCWMFKGGLPNNPDRPILISSDLLYDLYEAVYGPVHR